MINKLILTAILGLLVSISIYANAANNALKPSTYLYLICRGAVDEGRTVYHIVITPERLMGIPENQENFIQYSGEHFAVIQMLGLKEKILETVYTGRKEFTLDILSEDLYQFYSSKLNLKLTCNPNRISNENRDVIENN